MSLILDGTNGISNVQSTTDGTASTPAIRGTDTNTGIFFPAADTIAFAEGGAEVARFDSSGNLGIGVTPSTWSAPFASVVQIKSGTGVSGAIGGTSADDFRMFANTYYDGSFKRIGSGYATQYEQVVGQHIWFNASTSTANSTISFNQAMTLDSSGNLLVGTTTENGDGITLRPRSSGSNTTSAINFNRGSTATTGYPIVFQNGGSDVGYIQMSNTTVSLVNLSDYRLKENVTPMTGALAKVSALKPVTYTWKSDGSDGQGFIAHELQEVVPDCVSGEKDAVETYTDENGVEQTRPKYQGIDQSRLVATLTAAIQEQQAIITDLKARIETLENK
jgi:hypothetical protein